MEHGKFIVFEAIDGAGKDTQIELLKQKLEKSGKEVVLYSNIDNGLLKKIFRKMLTPCSDNFISSFHLSILILSDMAMTYKRIKLDMEQGKYVICSRWYLSSLAYGGGKSCREYDLIKDYIEILDIDPDLFIFISTSPEIAMNRLTSRSGNLERYESIDKLKAISELYTVAMNEQLAATVIVDGNYSKENVQNEINSHLYLLDRNTYGK